MTLSGINKQVAGYPGMLNAGIDQAHQQNPSIPGNELSGMKRAIEKAFVPELFINSISNEIRNNVTEEEASQLISWFESIPGQKITLAEENASKPEALQNMISEAQSLFSDTTRVGLAQKIDALVGSTDMTMQIQMDTAVAVFTSVSSALGQNQNEMIENFKLQLASREEQMRKNTEQFTIISFLYSYKNIDLETLKKYIHFLGEPNTIKFNDSVKKGLKYAFKKATNDMAKSLGILISSKES
jgi:hypothetical protein